MAIKVVFRKFKDHGDIIALFPREPCDRQGYLCSSYQHVGQHGSADPGIVSITVPAKPAEYAGLLKELKSIGYNNLEIRTKMTYNDQLYRKKQVKEIRG